MHPEKRPWRSYQPTGAGKTVVENEYFEGGFAG